MTMERPDIRTMLKESAPLLLSGAMGTEIQRRGVHTGLPLWSASALMTDPQVVKQIHRDYIDAGADIISTNTFRTNVRTFRRAGKEDLAKEMTLRACALAKEARSESGRSNVAIGGELAPVEDCYLPELVPRDEELQKEHAAIIESLIEGDVDFLFIETMNCIREARIASEIASATKLPFMVSFVCDPQGDLLSGETMEDAVAAIMPFGPSAFLTNCRPLRTIEASVEKLFKISSIPVGVYANGDGEPDDAEGWKFHGEHPEENYLAHAERWLEHGAAIVGGCCGTTPEYIRPLGQLIRDKRKGDKSE